MNDPKTADHREVRAGVAGMVLAVGGTMRHHEIKSYEWILVAMVLGTMVGVPLSRVALTAVPQRTALSHAFGGWPPAWSATAQILPLAAPTMMTALPHGAIIFEVILGYLHLHRSLNGLRQLQEILPHGPSPTSARTSSTSAPGARESHRRVFVYDPSKTMLFPIVIALALAFGVLLVLPIGGADMPTVISLLNSYAAWPPWRWASCSRTRWHHRRRATDRRA